MADLPVAVALYVLAIGSRQLISRAWIADRTVSANRVTAKVAAASVSALFAAFVGSWLTLQAFIIGRLPPDRLTPMFHALQRIEGQTTVVSTYASPVAIETGTWSYFDPVFFTDQWSIQYPTDAVTPHDYRYLWFADRASNESYSRPEYFVCLMHLSFYNVGSKASWPKCGQLAGIREIRDGYSLFEHREIARDEKNDLWSIVKLDWGSIGSRK